MVTETGTNIIPSVDEIENRAPYLDLYDGTDSAADGVEGRSVSGNLAFRIRDDDHIVPRPGVEGDEVDFHLSEDSFQMDFRGFLAMALDGSPASRTEVRVDLYNPYGSGTFSFPTIYYHGRDENGDDYVRFTNKTSEPATINFDDFFPDNEFPELNVIPPNSSFVYNLGKLGVQASIETDEFSEPQTVDMDGASFNPSSYRAAVALQYDGTTKILTSDFLGDIGTFEFNSDTGEFTFNPAPGKFDFMEFHDFLAIAAISTAIDDAGGTVVDNFHIRISGKNGDPEANDDIIIDPSITEDNVWTIQTSDLLVNDSDILDFEIRVGSVSRISEFGAILKLNRDGTITYDPTSSPEIQALDQDQVLEDTFTYRIQNAEGGRDTATATILVNGINIKPVANDDIILIQPPIPELTLNDQGIARFPDITTLSNGNIAATWTQNGEILFQILDPNGYRVVSEIAIDDDQNSFGIIPSIASLSDGGFVITWYGNGGQSISVPYDIKVKIFDNNGNVIISEFDATSGAVSQRDVFALTDGGFVVSWVSSTYLDRYSNSKFNARIFDKDGNGVGAKLIIHDELQYDVKFTALADGGFLAVWVNSDQSGASGSDIMARAFDSLGRETISEFVLNEYKDGSQASPNVTALFNGGFIVAWYGDTGDSSTGVSGQTFDEFGNKVGSQFLLNELSSVSMKGMELTALNGGGFALVYVNSDNVNESSDYYLKARIFDDFGNEVVPEFLVNTYTAKSVYGLVVTPLENGGFATAWRSYNHLDGSDLKSDINVQYFDALGNKVGAAVDITEDAVHMIRPSELLANDTDADGNPLEVTAVSAKSANGAIVLLNPDGNISYDPTGSADIRALSEGETLTDTFTYTISDGSGGTSSASVSIMVDGSGRTFIGDTSSATVSGKSSDDFIDGLAGNDQLKGKGGDDIFVGGEGNDKIFGNLWGEEAAADDVDTVIYNGNRADYDFAAYTYWHPTLNKGVVRLLVEDSDDGGFDGVDEGRDILRDIDVLVFNDETVLVSELLETLNPETGVIGTSGDDVIIDPQLNSSGQLKGYAGNDTFITHFNELDMFAPYPAGIDIFKMEIFKHVEQKIFGHTWGDRGDTNDIDKVVFSDDAIQFELTASIDSRGIQRLTVSDADYYKLKNPVIIDGTLISDGTLPSSGEAVYWKSTILQDIDILEFTDMTLSVSLHTNGDDNIVSTDENEVIAGYDGNDTFVFNGNTGKDTILDFQAGIGEGDVLEIDPDSYDFNYIDSPDFFDGFVDNGRDTTIRLSDTDFIVLKDVLADEINIDDFHFTYDI